jgi:type VII secretion integral membrane protein EccD
MTVSSSLADPDSESADEQELSRITVLVGELLVDVGVPNRASVSAIVNDVIELVNNQLLARDGAGVKFDNAEGNWTLGRLTGDVIGADRSLADAGVYDGELLVVRDTRAPASSSLVDDVEGMTEAADNRGGWFAERHWMTGWFGLGIALSVAIALLVSSRPVAASLVGVPVSVLAVLVAGIRCAVVAFVMTTRSGDPGKSTWLAAMALLLIFGGSLHVVPDAHGVMALPIALAVTALVAELQLLRSRRGRALYTTVIALSVLGAPAALAQILWNPTPRAVGAILATVAVIVVYLAPRVTIMLARLPVPRVPTAGEPLDDIETQGGTAVEGVNAVGRQVVPTEEGMADQVRRARDHLTGIVTAAAILAGIGCYGALDVSNGFFWQGTVFGLAVATVLCLRGRSHHDLVQSAVLIGGGLVIVLAVITKTAIFVPGWQVNAAIALVALTALLVVCGLVAPGLEFSPVTRRRVEILEYVAIATVFPLACSIIRLYAFFRELRV